jgi:hypothetical protein
MSRTIDEAIALEFKHEERPAVPIRRRQLGALPGEQYLDGRVARHHSE